MNKQKLTTQPTPPAVESELFIVGIGASAGGVEALTAFFEAVPAQSNIAYVVVLHLSPDFDSQLAQILRNVTPLPVIEVRETVKVAPDQVYVITPNGHLAMQDGHLTVLPTTTQGERRAPVDIFFRTLAESHGPQAAAVILSGTGANGSMGLKRIKEKGGAVFVQSPHQATFDEMPRQAMATDLVDEVLPVDQIPPKLIAYRQGLGQIVILPEADQRPQDQQQALREVFTQLRLRTGHDFSNYKRPTLLRRIERRISVHNLPDLPAYAAYLLQQPPEVEALLKDLLISVTNFFRDPAAFTSLEQTILPAILKKKKAEDAVRFWVAGCATGEEAYSLAMLAVERTQGVLDAPKVQIFASDIDEEAIDKAREGIYTLNDAADVSPERLARFFTLEGDRYRINRDIREMVLFARHNVLKDPPFSRMDLITCRNLLIYFNHTAQERALETFHFALNPGSYLLLGLSETTDSTKDLYATVNREYHLYQSRLVMGRRYPVPETVSPAFSSSSPAVAVSTASERRPVERPSFGDVHQRLRQQVTPPSILVNEAYDILHFTDRAERYFHFSGNEISRNLLKLIRPELRLELRTAFYQATQQQTPVEVRDLSLPVGEQSETLTIQVRPILEEGDPVRGYFLVLFEPTGETPGVPSDRSALAEPLARQLEDELVRVKSQLQTTGYQHELQAESLKASNEELQAMNEELRSSAEELETSKEELQSINEELTTVNQELKVKIDEVSLSSDNLRNLINSTEIATLFLDRSLRVNLFTPATKELFNLISADYGRSLTDITHRLAYHQLVEDSQQVFTSLQPLEREVVTTDGRLYILRISPYRTAQDRINGLVLTFVEITRRKIAEDALRESDQRKDDFLALLAHELRNPIATLSNTALLLEATGGTDEQLPLASVIPMISQEVQYLTRLVDDLLDISRINLGKIEFRPQRLELTELIRQVEQTSRGLIEQVPQQWQLHLPKGPLYVEGDEIRLKQVLRNLINNASKFTPTEGSIDLYLEPEDHLAVVRVVDTGIGLTKDALMHIFDRFAQIDTSHTRPQAGLGLGLALAQEIIRLHHGRIEARSLGLGQGSEFVIYLPLVD